MSMIDRQTDASAKLPVLTKIIIVAVLTPAILQLGPLTLSPSRIIFLFLVPFVFFRIVSGKYGGFLLSDFILIAFLGWFGLAMLINNPDKAVSFTGMNAVIALGGYFLARSSITNVETFRAALKFILLVVMVLLPFAIFEAVTNEFVIPKLISAIPGVEVCLRCRLRQKAGCCARAGGFCSSDFVRDVQCNLGGGISFCFQACNEPEQEDFWRVDIHVEHHAISVQRATDRRDFRFRNARL